MDLGKNMQEARKAAGMTQKELAEKMGVLQKDISRWETNVQIPNTMTFRKYCKIIGASSDDVLELNV